MLKKETMNMVTNYQTKHKVGFLIEATFLLTNQLINVLCSMSLYDGISRL